MQYVLQCTVIERYGFMTFFTTYMRKNFIKMMTKCINIT